MKLEEKINRELNNVLKFKEIIIDFEDLIKSGIEISESPAIELISLLNRFDIATDLRISRRNKRITSMSIDIHSTASKYQVKKILYNDFMQKIGVWVKPNSLEELVGLLKERVKVTIVAQKDYIDKVISYLNSTDTEFCVDFNESSATIIPFSSFHEYLLYVGVNLSTTLFDQDFRSIFHLPSVEEKKESGERMMSEVKYQYKGEEYDFAVLADENRYVYLSKDRNRLLIADKQGKIIEFVDLNSKDK